MNDNDRYGLESEVLGLVDGTRTAADLIAALCPPMTPTEGDVRAAIWRLITEDRIVLSDGLLLRPPPTSGVGRG